MSAVLILPHDADREEWLKRRREGIGASEIAAVMGISPYDSPFSLWWRKRMGWEIEPDAVMSTGTFLEPTIADWFAENGDPREHLAIHEAGLYASALRPWQLATPDRLLCDPQMHDDPFPQLERPDWEYHHPDDQILGLLECKWVAYSWDGWGEEKTAEVPTHYRAQALWQLDVMGVDEVFICALGPGGFRVYRVPRDEKDLRAMRESGRRFMDSLDECQPPNVDDHAATLPMIRRIHSVIEDREQEIPESIATGWLRSKRFKALAEKVEKRYAAMLRAHLGTAKTAICDGRAIAARSTDDKLMRKS